MDLTTIGLLLGATASLVTILIGLEALYRKLYPAPPAPPTVPPVTHIQAPTVGGSNTVGGDLVCSGGNSTVVHGDHYEGVPADLARKLVEQSETISDLKLDMADKDRQICELNDAITALSEQTDITNADDRIKSAEEELEKGRPEEAMAIYAEVMDHKADEAKVGAAKTQKALKEAARAARRLGVLASLDDTDKAIEAFRKSIEYDPDNPDGWNNLGHMLRRKGELDEARTAYEKVLALGVAQGKHPWIAIGHGNLGNIYDTLGESDKAEEAYLKALELSEKIGNKKGMASYHGNLGITYAKRDEIDRAYKSFLKALELNEELGRKDGMAADYGNLGILYEIRGEFENAEEALLKSMELNKELGRKDGMASQYGNLGNLYKIRDEHQKAEEAFLMALKMFKQLEDKEGQASAYGSLGIIYETLGELDRAEEAHLNALSIEKEIGRKEGLAADYGNLGALYKTRGELDRAEKSWRASLALYTEIGMPHMVDKIQGWLDSLESQSRTKE